MKNTKAQNDKVMGALKDEISRLKAQKEAASKDSLKLKKDLSEMQVAMSYLNLHVYHYEQTNADGQFVERRYIICICICICQF